VHIPSQCGKERGGGVQREGRGSWGDSGVMVQGKCGAAARLCTRTLGSCSAGREGVLGSGLRGRQNAYVCRGGGGVGGVGGGGGGGGRKGGGVWLHTVTPHTCQVSTQSSQSSQHAHTVYTLGHFFWAHFGSGYHTRTPTVCCSSPSSPAPASPRPCRIPYGC
jgi:hypothetical protein